MSEPDPKLLIGPVFEDAMSLFTDQVPATKPYRWYVTGEGASFGNTEPITRTIETFLTDIASIVIDGYSTRDVTLTLWVEADDERALAAAETDLMGHMYRPNLLWWHGPHPTQPWAVFEVSTSKLDILPIGETDFEENEFTRAYILTFTCGAWVRSKDEQIAGSTNPGSDTQTLVYGGDYLTGVTASAPSGTEAVSLVAEGLEVEIHSTSSVTRVVTVNIPVTPFSTTDAPWIIVRVNTLVALTLDSVNLGLLTISSGWRYPSARAVYTLGDDTFYYYRDFDNDGPYDEIEFKPSTSLIPSGTDASFVIADIYITPGSEIVGTPKQKIFPLEILGAVAARGAVEAWHDDYALGDTLVYTYAPGDRDYVPALRPFRDDDLSETTVDVALSGTSGRTEVVDDTVAFRYPVGDLPDGTYDVVLYVIPEDPDDDLPQAIVLDWTVAVMMGDNPVAQLNQTARFTIAPNVNWFQYVVIGQFTLPLCRLDATSDATLLVAFSPNPEASPQVVLDDGYILNLEVGDYSIVYCGDATIEAGLANNEIQLRAPEIAWPAPSIMVGVRDDAGSRYSPAGAKVVAYGRHTLEPGDLSTLLVTSNAADASAQARYYPRGHTNPEL